MKEKRFLKGALFGALTMLLVLVLGGCGTAFFKNLKTDTNENTSSEAVVDSATEKKLGKIQELIDQYFLYEVDDQELRDGIYAGYISGLDDKYAEYYNEEETKELKQSTAGEYVGVGAVLSQDYTTKIITISRVYEDSPAKDAGMKEGDILFQVDDREIQDESISEVVTWIKGEEKTKVDLYVYRDGEEVKLTATRRKVEARTVEHEMKDGQIGYLRITEFDSVTYDQFKEAMADLENQGMEGLVIDLRANPGGNLDTVCNILQEILPAGTIVTTEYKDGSKDEITSDGKNQFQKPLTVLVNQYSASAAEIFAVAVQDYKMGEIVGMTTYGKGVVQQVIYMDDGTAFKMTVAEYFGPNGNKIDEKGVVPDVEVEYEANPENESADNQLEKAMEVLREKL